MSDTVRTGKIMLSERGAAMPFVLVGVLGAVGGALLARVFLRETGRINAELAEIRGKTNAAEARATLRRDPETGEYRLG
jgi:hypothetical protein